MKKAVWTAVTATLICVFGVVQYAEMSSGGREDQWPKGTKITCIIPWAAGGAADTMARPLFKYWEQELQTNIIIDNRPGAATQMGTELFLKQPDDGSVIFVSIQTYTSGGVVLHGADFSMDDFDVLNFQQIDPVTITVHKDSPYRTLDDLFTAIKERPGQLTCGYIYGGPPHLAGVVLQERLGLDYVPVSYDSGNAQRTALLGGHVDFVLSNSMGDASLKGMARVLAVADEKRSPVWPDAQTFNEALGTDDFPVLGSARFIAVRSSLKKKYPRRYEKLLQTYKKAYDNPEYAAFRRKSGEVAVSSYRGPEASNRLNHEMHDLLVRYKERIQASKK